MKTGAAAVMLLLFVGYYVDVNFFTHAHIINGVTIVHSHVHNKHHHDTDEGGHTGNEITLIANMAGQFLSTGGYAQEELPIYHSTCDILGTKQDAQIVLIHLSCPSLRAPPVEKQLGIYSYI